MGSASSLQFDSVSVASIDQRQTAGPGSCCFGGASSAGPSAIPRRNRTATSTPLEADALQQLYRTRLPGQWVGLCGLPEGLLVPGGAHVSRAAMAVLLDQPLGVVAGDEDPDGVADIADGLEDAAVHDLLFQGAKEPFYDTVRLGLADEGIARRP